jgi:hypothetical protein
MREKGRFVPLEPILGTLYSVLGTEYSADCHPNRSNLTPDR